MGEYKPSEWYGDPTKWMGSVVYKPPWPKLHWWVYRCKRMCEWVPAGTERILDLGCGNGIFAAMLKHHNGYDGEYLGIDFSKESIDLALHGNRYLGGLPQARFEVGDISNVPDLIEGHDFEPDLIVCSEALEHVEDDLVVIESIPKGMSALITVPQFDAPAHLRCFPSWSDVKKRWGDLLEFERHMLMWTHWRPRGSGCWIMLAKRT